GVLFIVAGRFIVLLLHDDARTAERRKQGEVARLGGDEGDRLDGRLLAVLVELRQKQPQLIRLVEPAAGTAQLDDQQIGAGPQGAADVPLRLLDQLAVDDALDGNAPAGVAVDGLANAGAWQAVGDADVFQGVRRDLLADALLRLVEVVQGRLAVAEAL